MTHQNATARFESALRSLTSRVERGARWLDEHYSSSEWAGRIDLQSLDPTKPRCCVLGQLDGGFKADLKPVYGLTVEKAISLGFLLEDERKHHGEEWCALASVWWHEIEKRQHEPKHERTLEEDRLRQRRLALGWA